MKEICPFCDVELLPDPEDVYYKCTKCKSKFSELEIEYRHLEKENQKLKASWKLDLLFFAIICFLIGVYVGFSPMLPLDW